MNLQKQLAATLLLITTMMLVSFSQPASDNRGLMVMAEVDVLTEERLVAAARVHGTAGPRSLSLRATAYNSLPSQTFGDPNITATGAATRFGIIAASRDLIGSDLPYGSLVRLKDLGGFGSGRGAGQFQETLDGQGLFIVEDTMHIRKKQQVDVWFPELSTALTWGVREVELEVVRYGREGIMLEQPEPLLDALPAFAARTMAN